MPIEEKISVDYSELDDAEKAAKSLETTVKSSEAAQNKAVKEGINERTQTIRDGLAAQLKETRAGSQARVKEAQEALRKEEISEKEYAKRMVAIQAEAQKQIVSLKATRQQLLPQQVSQAAATSGGLGGFAVGALGVGALGMGLKSLAQAATQAESTLQGLDSVVGFKLGKQSIPQAHEELEKITKTGLLSKSDGAAAIKNLVSMGFALDDATNIILRNTDVAVKNRQANYSVSESVKIFTEGLKNGNSTLTDATGIQTNISVMLKKHGASLDDLNDKVRAGAARQAILKEVMAETAPFIGDAEKASKSYAGAIAKLSAAWDETKAAGGGFIAAVLTPLINIFTSALTGLRDFLKDMDGVNAAIIAITATAAVVVGWGVSFIGTMGGVGGMMVAISAKATAMWAAITGPIGLAIGLIAAAGAAIYAIYNATKPTPGQLLIQEKQQLEALVRETENAKNKTAEYEKAKKRLGDINKQITTEYGPYLQALGLEEKQLEKNIGLIREIDKTRKDVKKNVKDESGYEVELRVQYKKEEVESLINEAKATKLRLEEALKVNPNADLGLGNYFQNMEDRIREEKIKLQALQEEAGEKKPKATKSTNVQPVQEAFVADKTTVQQLEDLQRFYTARAALAREGAEADKIAEEMRLNQLQLDLAKRRFYLRDGYRQEIVSLDELERQKAGLEAASLKAVTQTQKADLAAALKVNQQKLQMVQKRIQAESQLEQEHQSWKKKAGQEMYEFGQALLSAEEGSFLKYLANKLRSYTAEKSAELYAEAAGYAATGNLGMAALYLAGGAAVQAAGELGAQALEKEADKKAGKLQNNGTTPDLGGISSPSAPDFSAATPGTSVTNVTNIITNEYGTYIREADFIRKQVRPEIQKMAAERGKVMFK